MTDQIVRLRITLEDIKPIIWRRIELPLANSLKTLHLAIQTKMFDKRSGGDGHGTSQSKRGLAKRGGLVPRFYPFR